MQILSTKLVVPKVRSRVVIRPRLLAKLSQGVECGFILVSAPAGYGKSTLMSSWLSRAELRAGWLNLDDRDNDPACFYSHLSAVFRSLDSSIWEDADGSFTMGEQIDLQRLLTPMINHLTSLRHPVCLVLDDYHTIQNQAIHQAMGFLLENRPRNLILVIATRADPPLPLAKLRARSGMAELRLQDLRFTAPEATDFLHHTMGLRVSPEDVVRITRRTEGWIAGLQMAALSMQNTDDISGFITSLTGSHHFIFDYLLEEILSGQPAEIQRFLLHTSILDQMTGSLCDAMFSGEDVAELSRPSSLILEQLEHANLFIIPLDQEQRWYRYHPLFAELLRGYLQKSKPTLVPVLHARASRWFEQNGLISDAIHYSLAANDWESVISLISANIFALLEQNELNNVARYLENITLYANPARPWLLVGRAWLAAYTGKINNTEPILRQAEAEINNLKSELELQTLGGHIAAIRAYINWIAMRSDIAARAAQAALEWLPEDEHLIRCQASTLLGLTINDHNLREEALQQALEQARHTNVSHVTIFAHGCWAWWLTMQGKLHQAYAACQDAITMAQEARLHQPLPTMSHVYTTLSAVLRQWNDLPGAVRYARQAVELAHRWEQADALHFALDNLGYALFDSGDVAGALDTHQQAWQVAQRTSPWFEEITIAQAVEWYLAQDNLPAALNRLSVAKMEIKDPDELALESLKSQFTPLVFIEVLLAQKQYSRALNWIDHMTEVVEKKNYGHFLIHLFIRQAQAYHGLRQEALAQASLRTALALATPEGYVRPFIQGGGEVVKLLKRIRLEGDQAEYVDRLLAAFDNVGKGVPVSAGSRLVEHFSAREMEVLRLLAQGCQDKKIAESLVIARETVRKHLKNIYGKLDVHSRTEAVARARQLGLL